MTATKKPVKPAREQPPDLNLGIPEQAFTEAAEAIWDGDDVERMIEALRAIDEPNPREIIPYFRLLVEIIPLLRRLIADGQGADAEVQHFGTAERAARRNPPAPGVDPSKWAGDVQKLADSHWRAFRRRSAAEWATQALGGLQWSCPKLFETPLAEAVADSADFEHVKVLMEGIWNWELNNEIEIERRDGWLFTQWRPRERRRRYRLRTASPPQQQGQGK